MAALVEFYTRDDEMTAIAWLHDILEEDTGVEFDELIDKFGGDIAFPVADLTNEYTEQSYPKMSANERSLREIDRLARCSDEVKIVKLADRLDNLMMVRCLDTYWKTLYFEQSQLLLEKIGDAHKRLGKLLKGELDAFWANQD